MDVSRRRRILVVDDDPEWMEALTDFLGEEGYTVEQAPNGLEALEKLAQTQPSVVVTDLEMPVVDGREFLAKAHARDGRVPIVVVSSERSRGDDPSLAKAFRVIRKPVPVEELLRAIEAAGEHRAAHLPLQKLWNAAGTASLKGRPSPVRAGVRSRLGELGEQLFTPKFALAAIALVSSFALFASVRGRLN